MSTVFFFFVFVFFVGGQSPDIPNIRHDRWRGFRRDFSGERKKNKSSIKFIQVQTEISLFTFHDLKLIFFWPKILEKSVGVFFWECYV